MGTEAFWVPAALAAAGAGANYVNTSQANARQQSGEVQSIIDQQKLQSQGNSQVKALTQQISQNTPSKLAGQATGAYVSALRKNAAGTQSGTGNSADILFGAPTSSLAPSIKGSSRYNTDTANSQDETEKYGTDLATEMGQIDAATRQRQNEGLAMGTLGTNLNLLGAQSYTQNFADQLKAQASGQTNPWLTLLSGVLSGTGSTLAKNAGGTKAPSNVFAGGGMTTSGTPVDAGSGLLPTGGTANA